MFQEEDGWSCNLETRPQKTGHDFNHKYLQPELTWNICARVFLSVAGFSSRLSNPYQTTLTVIYNDLQFLWQSMWVISRSGESHDNGLNSNTIHKSFALHICMKSCGPFEPFMHSTQNWRDGHFLGKMW